MKNSVYTFKGLKVFLFACIFGSASMFSHLQAGTPYINNMSVGVCVPGISSFSPASATAGSAGFVLTLNGGCFTDISDPGGPTDIFFNGNGKASTFISSTQMQITLTAADIAVAGSYLVEASNSSGGNPGINFVVNSCTGSTAATSTNWATASTWACGGVPTASSNVTIPTGVNVTLSSAATVNNLTLQGTGKVTLNGVNLTVNGTLTSSPTAFIVTQGGASSTVTQNVIAGVAKTFPIGSIPSRYEPFTINSNLTQTVSASVTYVLGTFPVSGYVNPQNVINCRWDITPASQSTVSTLSFTPSQASIDDDFNGYLAVGLLQIQTSGVGAGSIGHFISSARTYAYDQYKADIASGKWTVANYNGGYSPFQVGYGSAFNTATLAIDLTKISAINKGAVNSIGWVTASEKNNVEFQIERSADAKTFKTIGSVKGSGTTSESHTYNFEDKDPSVGTNYYRLKTIADDGTTDVSKIVSAIVGKGGSIKLIPSLVADKMTLISDLKSDEPFEIINMVGQVVLTGICQEQKELTVGHLPNGAYFVRIAQQSLKFVKN